MGTLIVITIRGGIVSMSRKTDKAYNTRQENINMFGTPKQKRKKYGHIVKELGVRNITLEDIASGLGDKEPGFLDMMRETGMTMDEAVILQQYSKAICNRDTKAAEFLRDTAGEKPSQTIDVNTEESGLSKMSIEDLIELRDLLKAQQKDN